MHTADLLLALVALTTAVAALAERLSLPAPPLLVLTGVAVGFAPGVPSLTPPSGLVAAVVLPPLVQAAAVELAGADLGAVAGPLALLSVGLVLATAGAVAAALLAVDPGVAGGAALVVGTALASTDPVAVGALARRLALPPRLRALVLGESLLNDATSLLLLQLVVGAVVAGSAPTAAATVGRLLLLAGGGAAVGVAVALVSGLALRRAQQPVTASVIALLAPYAAYLLAERLGASGVTAVVLGGLVVGRRRYRLTTGPARLQVQALYGVVGLVLESAVFAVLGLQVPALLRDVHPASTAVAVTAAALAAILATRAVGVAGAVALLGRPLTDVAGRRASLRAAVVVGWAGTRGVVPLAAALSLPAAGHAGRPFPDRALVVLVIAGTTALSLVGQGLTLAPVVRRCRLTGDVGPLQHEEAIARAESLQAALDALDDAARHSPSAAAELRPELDARVARAARLVAEEGAPAAAPRELRVEVRALRRELARAQTRRLADLVSEGRISEATRAAVQRRVDLDEARAAD